MSKKNKPRKSASSADTPLASAPLFDRVAAILEQARGNVVRAVNSNMVLAYWLIGREIVHDLQGGEERAEYGEQMLSELSTRLAQRYGNGFSVPNLQNFRKFYLAYSELVMLDKNIQYPAGTKSSNAPIPHPTGRELTHSKKGSPAGSELPQGFCPQLSWSHYRALMRVENLEARDFYEHEAAECGWSKTQLERQIHTAYYERILANREPKGLVAANRDRLPGEPVDAGQMLKTPYVLEFLGLPDPKELHESALEEAVINNLHAFLLELGKGFSFVARQKHIRFGDDDFYVDLVFYNYILKCFLLIDLKMGKLTHGDVGQMDGYVRLYEDRFKVSGDNPTIGLILCADKSEAVAKYSVLSEGRRIFASKYLQFLPSEKELSLEIAKERRLIEATMRERRELTGRDPHA
jgi:predicted nuclease of restriction endonuclease-like (RecB) superfamily